MRGTANWRKSDRHYTTYLESVKTIHGKSMFSCLIYTAVRLLEMRRVLKAAGSLWLHSTIRTATISQGVEGLRRADDCGWSRGRLSRLPRRASMARKPVFV